MTGGVTGGVVVAGVVFVEEVDVGGMVDGEVLVEEVLVAGVVVGVVVVELVEQFVPLRAHSTFGETVLTFDNLESTTGEMVLTWTIP